MRLLCFQYKMQIFQMYNFYKNLKENEYLKYIIHSKLVLLHYIVETSIKSEVFTNYFRETKLFQRKTKIFRMKFL